MSQDVASNATHPEGSLDASLADRWDCHVHVFEPRYEFASPRAYTPAPATVGQLRKVLEELAITRAVLVQPSPYGNDNACILDALAHMGGSHRAVIAPSPGLSLARLRELRSIGVRGLRLTGLGRITQVAPEVRSALAAALDLAEQAGISLEISASVNALLAMAEDIRGIGCPLVLPHLAGLAAIETTSAEWHQLAELVVEQKLWIKVSGIDRFVGSQQGRERLEAAIAWLVKNVSSRLVWGSDWPHTAHHSAQASDAAPAFRRVDRRAMLDLFRSWIDDCTADLMFRTNPQGLYE